MKNIQVIDGADNSIFPVYAVSDADFALIFPAPGQNVEFMQDLSLRLGGDREAGRVVMRATRRHLEKTNVAGIHGTLFIDLANRKKYFPNKREDDVYVP